MQISELSLNTNFISAGALLGTNSKELLQRVANLTGGGSYFGSDADPHRGVFNYFQSEIVDRIRNENAQIQSVRTLLKAPDEYRVINSVEELKKGIPPCMREGILYYEPIRDMLNEGRIDGFGVDPNTLGPTDPYKHLCENGKATVHSTTVKDGKFELEYNFYTTDPDLTPEEIMCLDLTREYIDIFLKDELTMNNDFTDYPSLHG